MELTHIVPQEIFDFERNTRFPPEILDMENVTHSFHKENSIWSITHTF
jgi:hypothetical protein